MNTGEENNSAIQMLYGYYDGRNETLRITSSVLKEKGFGEYFWQAICPRLGREGILKEWPSAFYKIAYFRDEKRFSQLSDDYHKTFDYSPEFKNLAAAERERIQKEIDSMEHVYPFVVDGKKLKTAYDELRTEAMGGVIDDRLQTRKAAKMPRITKPTKHLISKDIDDYFLYSGKIIELNRTNVAYDILDILYSRFPMGGFLSYEEIGKDLKKRGKGDGSKKAIQNAVGEGQGFFRIAKVGGKVIRRINPDGKELIKIFQGKGLQFNNPPI